MHIFFWWDYKINNFLFYGYDISTVVIFIVTCFGLLILSFLFELMKLCQAKIKCQRLKLLQLQLQSLCPIENDTLYAAGPSSQTTPQPLVLTRKDRILFVVNDFGLWISQQVTAFFLMLVVMLFNGYMVIAVIVGSTFGYFLFGPALMKINIENCKAKRNTFCMSDCGTDQDRRALLRENNGTENSAAETSPVCHASSTSTVITEIVQT